MQKVYYIGLDLAKNVFQLSLADKNGKQIANKKMTRDKMIKFLTNMTPCIIGMEACGTAHFWARTLIERGHDARLIQPIRVKAFLGHNNKTDAADARAICEAVMHPGTQFVAIKTVEQQDVDHLLDRRDRLVANRTQIINQTRAFLAERGISLSQGAKSFTKQFQSVCADHWEEFSGAFQLVLTGNADELQKLNDEIQKIEEIINVHIKQNEKCKDLMTIPGFGPLIAIALFSQVGNGQQFKNGRQMSAYLGITPREHSSGGKQRLSGITKRGNARLRMLLILGARAILTGISRRKKDENGKAIRLSVFDSWALAMKERLGVFKAAVAIANKLCRIAWVVLAKNEVFVAAKAIAYQK